MTPEAFHAALTALGLNHTTGARALGVTARSVRRWVSGAVVIPRLVELALIGLGRTVREP